MKFLKTRLLLVYILLYAVMMSACSNSYLNNEYTIPTLQITVTPSADDVTENTFDNASERITMGICGFDTLHPLKTENEALSKYLTLVYDSPVTMGKDASIEPQLIQEWNTSDGGTTWYFKLKENIKFHDGSECTIYDVKNTMEWIIANGGKYSKCVEGISAFNILSVYEIEIVLEENDAFFPCKMIFPVMKSDDLQDNFSVPNGTGRYKYAGQNSANGFLFELYKEYYGAFPKIASVEILNYDTAQDLYSSNVDVMMFFDDDVLKYNKKENSIVCGYNDDIFSCMLPSKNTDIEIRNYINNNLDKRLLLLGAAAGAGTQQLIPLSQGTYYLKEIHEREIPNGRKPENIKIIVNEANRDLVRLALLVKSQLEELEIVCEITEYTSDEYIGAVISGEYDFAMVNMQMGLWPDLYDVFATDGKLNYTSFSDSSIDNLIASLRNAYDESESTGVTDFATFVLYAEQQTEKIVQRLHETLPVIGLYNRDASVILKNTVKNVGAHNFTFWNTLESFNEWYMKEDL